MTHMHVNVNVFDWHTETHWTEFRPAGTFRRTVLMKTNKMMEMPPHAAQSTDTCHFCCYQIITGGISDAMRWLG